MPGSLLWFPPGGPGNGPMPRPPACIGRTTPRSLTPGAELLSDSRSCFFNKKTCRENRGHPVKIRWRNFICCSECSLHQWSKRVKRRFLFASNSRYKPCLCWGCHDGGKSSLVGEGSHSPCQERADDLPVQHILLWYLLRRIWTELSASRGNAACPLRAPCPSLHSHPARKHL